MASGPEAIVISSADEEALKGGNGEDSTGLRFSPEREAVSYPMNVIETKHLYHM